MIFFVRFIYTCICVVLVSIRKNYPLRRIPQNFDLSCDIVYLLIKSHDFLDLWRQISTGHVSKILDILKMAKKSSQILCLLIHFEEFCWINFFLDTRFRYWRRLIFHDFSPMCYFQSNNFWTRNQIQLWDSPVFMKFFL